MPRRARSAARTAPAREPCLHGAQMRRRADRHLAASAHLREGDAESVLDRRGIGAVQLRGRRRAGDEAEELGRKPAFGHRPVGNAYARVEPRVDVGACGDGCDEIAAAHAAKLLGDGERHRNRDDADVPARADVVVIDHVAEAAVDEHRPRRRRFAAEAPHRRNFFSAHVFDEVRDDLRFGRERRRRDRHAERIEHALLDELDERARQIFVAQRQRAARSASSEKAQRPRRLLRGHAGAFHDLAPLRHFGCDVLLKRGRRAADRLGAVGEHAVAQLGRHDGLVGRRRKAIDDRRACAGRREQPVPRRRRIAGSLLPRSSAPAAARSSASRWSRPGRAAAAASRETSTRARSRT